MTVELELIENDNDFTQTSLQKTVEKVKYWSIEIQIFQCFAVAKKWLVGQS